MSSKGKAATTRSTIVSRVAENDRWQTLLGSVPTAVLAVCFWLQDAIDPLTAPSLLVDRTLQALTLFLVPALVLVMVASIPIALRAAIFVAATGTVLSSTVWITGFMRPPRAWPFIAAGILAFLPSAMLLIRFAPRLITLRSGVAKVAAALLAAAVPLLQFWNSVSFLPGSTEAALSQSVSVATVEEARGRFQTEVTFRAKNETGARVLVIITRMTVCWWNSDAEPLYADVEIRALENCTVIRPLERLSWLPPKYELVYSRAVTTPVGSPRLTVVSRIAYARGDRLRVSDDATAHDQLGACQNVEAYRLREESRIKSLAQVDKYLVYADKNRDGGVEYYFDFGSIECPGKDDAEQSEYFGATETRGVFEEWLTVPPAASR